MHAVESVRQPRRVGQQVLDRHRRGGRHRDQFGRRPPEVDPHVRECRHEVADRIRQLEGALLVKHHGRYRGDRLGHRVDAEERVRLDGKPCLHVTPAVRRGVDDAPVPAHEHQPARQPAVVHVPHEVPVDPGQPVWIEPCGTRLDLGLCYRHRAPTLASRPRLENYLRELIRRRLLLDTQVSYPPSARGRRPGYGQVCPPRTGITRAAKRRSFCADISCVIQRPLARLSLPAGRPASVEGGAARYRDPARPRSARAARAAPWPHMPCTPPPGGVDAEHR